MKRFLLAGVASAFLVANAFGLALVIRAPTGGGGGAFDGVAQLPTVTPQMPGTLTITNTQTLTDTGNVTTNGNNLQAAIITAASHDGSVNDDIVLPTGFIAETGSGSTSNCNGSNPGIQLKYRTGANKGGTGWIRIRSNGTLPASSGNVTSTSTITARTNFAADQSQLAVVRMPSNASGASRALCTETAAHHYILQGLEISVHPSAANSVSGIADLGSGGSDQSGNNGDGNPNMPHHFIVDRSYLHGVTSNAIDVSRCLSMNGGETIVIDSWLAECHSQNADAQALGGWNGAGPYLIQNNHLEGSGENFMFGGSDPWTLNLLRQDITIWFNHMIKPAAWFTSPTVNLGYSSKNLGEFKGGQRVLIANNVFENHWNSGLTTPARSGQPNAINLKTNNQGDSEANNVVRLASTANLSLSGLSAIDGFTPIAGDLILAKNQTAGQDNGIYVAASGGWTRATFFDQANNSEIHTGATVYVTSGTANGDKTYDMTTATAITVGTTPLTFALDTAGIGRFQNRGEFWSTTTDVTMRYNIMRNSHGFLSLVGNASAGNVTQNGVSITPAVVGSFRWQLHDNLAYNIGNYNGEPTTSNQFIAISAGTDQSGALDTINYINNTMHSNRTFQSGPNDYMMSAPDPTSFPGSNFAFTSSIFGFIGVAGVKANSTANGTASVTAGFGSNVVFGGDVFAGSDPNTVSLVAANSATANQKVSTQANIGWASATPTVPADFVATSPPASNGGVGGGITGADVATVILRTANVVVP